MTQQKLGPTPRYEHAGFDGYTQPGKLRPSHDLLQWRTAHTLSDHVFELAGRVGCAKQHVCLVFGEHAAG